jgi:hypothetical protein
LIALRTGFLAFVAAFAWAGACASAHATNATQAETTVASAAAFDFELYDTSLEGEVRGENPDERRRLLLISDLLRRLLRESGRFEVLDLAPVAARIAAAGQFRGCNGCAVAIARDLGADLAVTGVVQKVSNLILNINIYLYDAESGRLAQAMSADIRGNTDESWSRGVSWLVRNRLLAE